MFYVFKMISSALTLYNGLVVAINNIPRRKPTNRIRIPPVILLSIKWTQIQACAHTGNHTFVLMAFNYK